jgi:hypothetical protein
MRKSLALAFILILVTSSLIMVEVARAQTKPSVPEFTVTFIDKSYDAPASTSIDPYTGKTVTNPSYHVENRTIELTIKNQPHDSSDKLYYNIRAKGHFAQNWTALYGYENSPRMSNSDYTILVFSSSGEGLFRGFYGAEVYAPSGGEVDFQVEAFVGGYEYVEPQGGNPIGSGWHFKSIAESGWSNSQTITVDASVPTATPNTSTSSPSQTPLPAQEPFPTVAVGTVSGAVAVVAIGVGLLVYFKKHKH